MIHHESLSVISRMENVACLLRCKPYLYNTPSPAEQMPADLMESWSWNVKVYCSPCAPVYLLALYVLHHVADDLRHYHPDQHGDVGRVLVDRKSTRLNSSHVRISYAVFCLKKKNKQ